MSRVDGKSASAIYGEMACREGPVRVARAVADRPDPRDEIGENGIAGCDLVDRRPQRQSS